MPSHANQNERIKPARQAAGALLAERVARLPPWVVTTQLFIGLGWIRAVTEKIIDLRWWSGATIDEFLDSHQGSTLAWYQPLLDEIVIPATPFIAVLVVLGQLTAAISLITGRRLALGLSIGMFLNVNFVAAGAVSPSAFYLLSQGALALWMIEQRPRGATTKRLDAAAAVATFFAAANVLFISTLHPDEVLEDPAMMFVLGSTLTTLACLLAAHAVGANGLRSPCTRQTTLRTSSATGAAEIGGAFSARIGPR